MKKWILLAILAAGLVLTAVGAPALVQGLADRRNAVAPDDNRTELSDADSLTRGEAAGGNNSGAGQL